MSNATNKYNTPVGLQQPAAADLSDGTTGSGAVVEANSPALLGTPTAPTPSIGDSTTKLATTSFVAANADTISKFLVNGSAVVNPFTANILVNGIGGEGEIEQNGYIVSSKTPCMIERPGVVGNVSRFVGTVYYNNLAFPILVQAGVSTGSTQVVWTASADSSINPSTVVYKTVGDNSTTINNTTLTFFVFPGQYYKVVAGSGTPVTGSWREYICQTGTIIDSGNLSGSKAFGTIYQNTTTGVKVIVVQAAVTTSGTSIQGISDASPAPVNIIDDAMQTSGANNTVTVFMIVPPGHYYKINATSGSLSLWHEYSWNIPCTKSNDLALSAGGSGAIRAVVAVSQTTNTGAATATSVMLQCWINGTDRVRWVQNISFNSLNTGNFAAMNSGEGIPAGIGVAACTQTAANAPRHLYGPIMPGNTYMVTDTSNGTLTTSHWWEYQLG